MTNVVKKAVRAFQLEQYELAKYYYQLASDQLGEKFFKNNIKICDLYLSRVDIGMKKLSQKNIDSNIFLLDSSAKEDDYILLDTAPAHSITLSNFDSDNISLYISYNDSDYMLDQPLAIAKFRFFNADGIELNQLNESTGLSWSSHLNCYYLYVRSNEKKRIESQFRKPIEVTEIIIEFDSWHSKTVQLLNSIGVSTKNDNTEIKLSSLLSKLDQKRGEEYFSFQLDNNAVNNEYIALNKANKIVLNDLANDAEDITISIPCFDVETPKNGKPSGIVKFKFYDDVGQECTDLKSTNLSWSEHLKSWYFYITIGQNVEKEQFEYSLFKPKGIRSIIIVFDKWHSDSLQVYNNVEVIKRPSINTFIQSDYAILLHELYQNDTGTSRYKPTTTKICYVLNHSLPYQSEGYATRAHGLAKAISKKVADIICVTRPGYPASFLSDYKGKNVSAIDVIDNIKYERVTQPTGWRGSHNYIAKAAIELEKRFLEIQPSCVMAASDFKNALPALIAAKRVGIPFIYEVRGFWEITHISRDPSVINTSNYHLTQFMETEVAKHSDYVFTLTDAMRRELVRRGVDNSKIDLLPNSCDPTLFDPNKNKYNKKLAKKLGIPLNVPVIGYIGTFNSYEGLDDLMNACGRLYEQGNEFRILLVGAEPNQKDGAGPCSEEIVNIARNYGFSDWLIMPGRVPHEQVADYYSLITITPFTRKPLPITELVSPLKPLEAMAMGKTLVVSSVEALSEMVRDNETGLIYEKGNIDDLYYKLAILFDDAKLCTELGKSAKNWVKNNRTWELCSEKVVAKVNALEEVYKTRELSSIYNLPSKKACDYTVAFIADEFTYNSFRDEFNAVIVEPDNWRELFEQQKPDIFFCESAWSGVDSQRRPWQGKIYTSKNWKKENRTILLNILDYCRNHGIPTVFWNKEDPTHFTDRVHDFIATAKEFDYVFTTAEECCELYRKEYGVKNVSALPFATNPKLFNPIEQSPRDKKVVFAGSWYANHEERSKDMEFILDNILKSNLKLEVIDRYYGNNDPLHEWPKKYLKYTNPSLPHTEMPNVYRSSIYGLNFNTVTDSKTMFARRVFELMSANTLVVSNYSRGVDEMFGDLVIFADRDPKRLRNLTDEECSELRERALNLVLKEHTYTNRWEQILTSIGMPWLKRKDDLTLVFKIYDENDVQIAINAYQSQFSQNPDCRLLLLISYNVDPLIVSDLYQKYNRAGISVTSEKHIKEYALEDKYQPITTKYFIYGDRNHIPISNWVENALLHFQYVKNICIAPAMDSKYKYQSVEKCSHNFIGHAEDFYKIFRDEDKHINVYLV